MQARIIIIEDLSPEIVDILGTELNIDPDFFVEYLTNSRFDLTQPPDPSPARWKTSPRCLPKQYVSLRWSRLVNMSRGGIFLEETKRKGIESKDWIIHSALLDQGNRAWNNVWRLCLAIGASPPGPLLEPKTSPSLFRLLASRQHYSDLASIETVSTSNEEFSSVFCRLVAREEHASVCWVRETSTRCASGTQPRFP